MGIFGVEFGEDFVPPAEKKNEQLEKKCENIEEMMAYYAEQVNKVFEKYKVGEEALVSTDCKINLKYFNEKNGGHYSNEEVRADEELKEDLYNQWAAKEYNLTEDTDVDYIIEKVAEYKRKREESRGEQSEKLLLLNLNKVLSPDYFVIHASDYDDLENGVDYVVVEAKTGVIACGFDAFYDKYEEVAELEELLSDVEKLEKKMGEGENTEHNYQQKLVKLKMKSQRYGTQIKYGFSVNDDKLEGSRMTNMPAFALRLSPREFEQLQTDMNFVVEGENARPNDIELKIFDGLMSSLEEQSKFILDNPKTNLEVKENLDFFNKALARMKSIRANI